MKLICGPMATISHPAFRMLIEKFGGCDEYFTEMINAGTLLVNGPFEKYYINPAPVPQKVVWQLTGNDKEKMTEAARILLILEGIGIDINMGCPVPKVAIKSQAGSGLLKEPKKIYDIVSSVVKNVRTPVTVKIRAGWDNETINCIEVAKIIEKAGASAIAIHPRTRVQGYSGKANWELIKQVKQSISIPVIGNGDITTIYEAKKMLDETSCDAIMIGRATLGNPWFIKECIEYVENNKIIEKPTYTQRINMLIKHYQLLKANTNERKAILDIKTPGLYYLKYIPGTKELKKELSLFKNEKDSLICIGKIKEHVKLLDCEK